MQVSSIIISSAKRCNNSNRLIMNGFAGHLDA